MFEAHPVAELMRKKRFEVVRALALWGSQCRGRRESCVAVVAKKVSASRIWPAKAAGADNPAVAPGALAVMVRVNARTPLVNAALD